MSAKNKFEAWFTKLKEVSQLILVLAGMAFIIAIIDPTARVSFVDAIKNMVEAVTHSIDYWRAP